MLLDSLDPTSNPVAHYIQKTVSVSLTAATMFAATTLVPTGAWAHSRHHSHHHHASSQKPAQVKYPSPVDVAGVYAHNAAMSLASAVNHTRSVAVADATAPAGDIDSTYAHTAAINLACYVNRTRATMEPHRMTAHEIRLARHNERVALREQHQHAHSQRVAMQDAALRSGNVVAAAYSFRGTRYVFGGTSRSGFDCSSFVRFILGHADGVELPRTAEEQYYHGTPVDRDQLQPGDLVFFKNTYRHGISHVGIYTGNGKFVHAANSHKGVREDNLDEPYYAHHYAGARRVIGIR